MGLIKAVKDRWSKGQTGLQKSALFIKKNVYKGDKSEDAKSVGKKGILNFAENVEAKRNKVTKDKKKASRKSRARMTKAQKREFDRKQRSARAKAWRENRAKNKNK